MNKFTTFAIMSAALLGSQVANAHHVAAPTGPKTGMVAVSKGINLSCALDINFLSSTQAFVHIKPGDPNCAALLLNGSNTGYTYNYTYNASTHEVTFHNLDVTTITIGDCSGDIKGIWNGAGLSVNSFLPAKTSGAPCTVIGIVS